MEQRAGSADPRWQAKRLLLALVASCGLIVPAVGQEPPADADLAQREARLAERFERLEILAERLAELSQSTQPRRAKILRDLVARSRERDLSGRMEGVIAALQRESYSQAIEGGGQVHQELAKLLELLLQEDRDGQIEAERKRIGRYLQEIRHVIRLERGLKGRTEGGDETNKLAEEQAKVAERTGKLGGEVEKTDGSKKSGEQSENQGQGGDQKSQGEQGGEGKRPREGQPPSGSEGKQSPQQGQPSPGEPQPSPGGEQSGKPSPSQQGESQPSGDSGGPSTEQQDEQRQSPADKAVQRMRRAQQRMEEATKKLEKAIRDDAVREQEEALKELEQAKAELERILRQLREEELERTLVLLEARFRKMLEAQVEVYEDTKRLDASADKTAEHEREMTGGRLARAEREIEREADRALVLMREDGSTVAFPEAIEQARTDMRSIADRLGRLDAGMITQGLEEDVIATLEETLAAMQRALQDLRDQRARGSRPGGGGEPGEQPLVAKLAELRMIRSLQAKVNRRTVQYGALIQGEMALDADLRAAVIELGERQERIYQAAHDLDTRDE